MGDTDRKQLAENTETKPCQKGSQKDVDTSNYDWFDDEPERDPKRIGRLIGEAVLEKLLG